MIKWLIEKFEEWKFNREFEKKKKELLKADPFIYNFEIKNDSRKNKD
tara:strand:- start:2221 stop:2361 length:141 start_codon:yes stop_codon:yes gene_type:complete